MKLVNDIITIEKLLGEVKQALNSNYREEAVAKLHIVVDEVEDTIDNILGERKMAFMSISKAAKEASGPGGYAGATATEETPITVSISKYKNKYNILSVRLHETLMNALNLKYGDLLDVQFDPEDRLGRLVKTDSFSEGYTISKAGEESTVGMIRMPLSDESLYAFKRFGPARASNVMPDPDNSAVVFKWPEQRISGTG